MSSERIQKRIERFLDQAEEAADSHDWDRVFSCVDAVLEADPDNGDAQTLKRMAEAAQRSGAAEILPSPGTTQQAIQSPTTTTETVSTDQPTSFASGRYSVSKFLGEGGKKKVYLAHDNTLDRDIAFALIKTEGLDETSRERVKREAQAMGRMGTHPCIMPIYDLGEESGQPFMVQPLMSGGDVEGLVEEAEGPLELDRAIEIATQTAQGLSFAHSKGIVHRDLKPGNVWLDGDGAAKIGDFGLAVATDHSRLTVEKVMVGTVSYMPPEQATGGEVTPRADLYSLGAMLYEMCTGRVPFMGDDDIGIISQHINTPPVAPSWHNNQIPKTLDSLILRLLSKDPTERPESADEVLAALKSVDLTAVKEREEGSKGSLDAMAGGVFVGRNREMDQLKSIFEDVLSGKGRMVTIVGEPGIGKTRTAQELATYAGMRGAEVLWGRSYESGGAPPYWSWVQAIRSHVAATEPQALRDQLGGAAPVIAEVVSDVKVKLPDLPAPSLIEDPESARFRVFDSISTFLKNLASATPLVLMLEDLHWSDKPSLMLLEFVARELSNSRILIVGNYRDMELNRRHPLSVTLGDLSRERLFERVVLRGLQRHDVQRFIEIAAGIAPQAALVDTIFNQTEGNPLFVTETVRLLIQEGDITSGQSSKGGTTSWEIRIPEGVREVIGRRLDRLSERCNEVLTIAAVIGRQFRFDVLKMLAEDTTDNQLLDAMDEALSARIIEELQNEVGFYQFTHAQMQETMIQELSHTRAVRMHARIAEALEEYYGAEVGEHAAELVAHFAEAETVLGTEKLVEYSRVAGERALDRFAHEDAATYFRTGLSGHTEKDEIWASLTAGLARAVAATAGREQIQDAADLLQSAFHWFAKNDQPMEARALATIQFPHFHGTTGMADMYTAALNLVDEDDLASRSRFLIKMVRFKVFELGQTDLGAAREALEIARALDDPNLLLEAIRSENYLTGRIYGEVTDLTTIEEEMDTASLATDLSIKFASYDLLGIRLTRSGLNRQAEEVLDLGIETALELHTNYAISWGFSNRGHYYANKGMWSEALDDAEAASSSSPDDWRVLTVPIRVNLARGHIDQYSHDDLANVLSGRFGPSVASLFSNAYRIHSVDYGLVEMVTRLQGILDDTVQFEASMEYYSTYQLCSLAWALQDRTLAEKYFPAIADRPTNQDRMGVNTGRVKASLLLLLGDPVRAVEQFEDGLRFTRMANYRPELGWTSSDYSEFLLERNAPGDREKAIELQNEAISIATELGMKPLLERVLAKREILKA